MDVDVYLVVVIYRIRLYHAVHGLCLFCLIKMPYFTKRPVLFRFYPVLLPHLIHFFPLTAWFLT